MVKIAECMERVRLLKTLYNDAAPINRTLPKEILMEILGRLRPMECRREEGIKFLHVCRLWRQVLLAVPEFWVDLLAKPRILTQPMSEQQKDRLRFTLGLTGSRPLTLSLGSKSSGFPLQLAQIIAPYQNRIVSLTLSTIRPQDSTFLKAFFHDGLPLLERLSVNYVDTPRQDVEPLIDFRRALFPRLRYLKHPFGLFKLCDIGTQLRELALFYCISFHTGRNAPSTLTSIMACCTSLESLSLHDTIPEFEDAPEHLWLRPPNTLLKLKINDTRGDLLHNVLPYLAYPPTCRVDIHCFDAVSTFAGNDGFLHRDSQPYRQLRTADEIRLGVGTVEARVGGTRRLLTKVDASWSWGRTVLVHCIADFAALFSEPFTKVTTLQISIPPYDPLQDDIRGNLRRLLAAFTNVVRLDVRGCDGRHDIIPLLKESAGPSGACACPRLEELRIDWLRADDEAFSCSLPSDGIWHRFGPAVFARFCEIVRRMLKRRISSGAPLKRLTVGVASGLDAHYFDGKRWDPVALTQRLRESLGQSLEDVDVVCSDQQVQANDESV
ncbi:hypothetical protein L226DRAFT_104752 [Lentinus tigrinus ALCF2SS1-7]|uniref:uncharacterized protein n=1 Tax=Lentinus tigrinus ALCF2SS1-7 TaxID=1328758 RepID=UPI001165F47D|nr:hypothetical protein L226DRAFT_104752 [Lentinus tigrinus ALCF2SS1-7]